MSRIKDSNGVSQRSLAYDLLRRALVLREISGGQRLREAQWAQRLGVNRTALREAFGRLCAEGLIVEGPRGGYFAASLGPEETRDALEIRIMLEAGAIDRICRLGLNKPKHLKPLGDACDDLEWLLRRGYSADLAESDRRFHEALAAAAGSDRLTFVYRCIPPIDVGHGICGDEEWSSFGQAMLTGHRNILAALLKNRPAEAQRLLRIHLTEIPSVPDADSAGAA